MEIKKRNWDSIFWGINIAELTAFGESPNILNDNELNQFNIIETAISKPSESTLKLLTLYNFKYIETKVLFHKKLNAAKTDNKLIKSQTKDFGKLCSIVNGLYHGSRFYLYNREKVDLFYHTWIENAINGTFDDFCYHYEVDGNIVGFITLKVSSKHAKIGLLGVSKDYQTKGIGSTLVRNSENIMFSESIESISVVTQEENCTAMKFYFKNDYSIQKTEKIYLRINDTL